MAVIRRRSKLRVLFICTVIIFLSLWCTLDRFTSQTVPTKEYLGIYRPLSVDYNGTLVSSIYEKGFDVNPNICQRRKQKVRLLVLVHSSPAEDQRRESIRRTWKAFGSMGNVSVAFLLGRTRDDGVAAKVLAESRLHGDLIVSRNVDSFDNLTLKSIAMAEWTAEHCPGAGFVVKVDSDVFLNVARLSSVVDGLEADGGRRWEVYGQLLKDTAPLRDKWYKHRVSEEEYPAGKYPDYVIGGTYMFTGDLAGRQVAAALGMRYFRMEDVFLTGLVTERLGARLVHLDNFFSLLGYVRKAAAKDDDGWQEYDACDLRRRVAVHDGQYDTMFRLWGLINARSVRCECACS